MMLPLRDLWESMEITDSSRFIRAVRRIRANQGQYDAVAEFCRIPWQIVAVLHTRESDGNFKRHLHNGDPLTARTVRVPKGYPLVGEPPFTWEESARDALALDNLSGRPAWTDIATTLDRIERYNGLGYRRKGLPSPYLWAGTNHEPHGKYTRDGFFDPTASDKQPGAAGLLKLLGYRTVT
jgi:lysozyme family protein